MCASHNLQSSKYVQHSKHVVSKRLKMQRFRTASFFGVKYTAILSDESSSSTSEKKKMPKRVGATTQPCFTPFLIGKGPEAEPSYWTVPCMSSWKDVIILRSFAWKGIRSFAGE